MPTLTVTQSEVVSGPLGPATVMRARVEENARAVAGYAGRGGTGLRPSFLGAMESLQSLRLRLQPEASGTTPIFTPSQGETEAWLAIMAIDALPEDFEYSDSARHKVENKLGEALGVVRQHDLDTFEAINTIIGTFVCARLEHFEGGSISSLIGAIWIALAPERQVDEFAELIVHEYVHNALFLEDMVHGVFVDGEARLGQADALVTSAILKIPRGYDKAFHSAVVSVVLAEFQQRLGLHEKARASVEPLVRTLVGLREKDDMLTENGRRVLSELEDWVSQSTLVRELAAQTEVAP